MPSEDWQLFDTTSAFPGETVRQVVDRWVLDAFTISERRRITFWKPQEATFKLLGGRNTYRIELDCVGAHGWPQYRIYKRTKG